MKVFKGVLPVDGSEGTHEEIKDARLAIRLSRYFDDDGDLTVVSTAEITVLLMSYHELAERLAAFERRAAEFILRHSGGSTH